MDLSFVRPEPEQGEEYLILFCYGDLHTLHTCKWSFAKTFSIFCQREQPKKQ